MTRATRWAAAGVMAVGLLATTASGQPPAADPIAAAKQRQQIADQKAAAEVTTLLADADRVAKTNPVRAAQILKAAQTEIDTATILSGDTRTKLTTAIQAKLAAVEGRAVAAPAVPAKTDAKVAQKAAFDSYVAEIKDVKDSITKIADYQTKGAGKPAADEIARLNRSYPNNPAVIALTQTDTFSQRLADSRELTRLMDQRVVLALNDVQRSAIPAKGDIEFPADWKERTARRKSAEPQLTPREQKLLESLDKPVTVSYAGQSLEEVLQDLSNKLDQPLFIDAKSITDAAIDLKKPVTLQGTGVATRTLLRQLLGANGLTFVVKDEAIQVVTVDRARDLLVTRVYYLGDLVQGVGPFAGAYTWGPLVDYQQTSANVGMILDAIQASVDPLMWKKNGGPCTIGFHFPSMSVIVKASTEVHATLGAKLGGK